MDTGSESKVRNLNKSNKSFVGVDKNLNKQAAPQPKFQPPKP